MDITYLKNNSLRIKGRTSSVVIDPTPQLNKTEGNSVLALNENVNFPPSKIEGLRITINGPGEYEIGGIKISSLRVEGDLVANLDVDNIKILVGEGSAVEEIHEKMGECNIALIRIDKEFKTSVLTSLEPNVLLLYGERKEEVAKSLGKEEAAKVTKFWVTSEKLPSEMQVFLLG